MKPLPQLLLSLLLPSSCFSQTLDGSNSNLLHNYLTWSRVTDTQRPYSGDAWAGANMFNIDNVIYYQFCMEPYTGGTAGVYDTSRSLDTIYGSTKAGQFRALVENTMPVFLSLRDSYLAHEPSGGYNAAYDDNWDQFTGYGAAMQFAIWEILSETGGILNLQSGEATSGTYYLSGSYPVGTITGAERALHYGIPMIDQLASGAWTDPGADGGNFKLTYGDHATHQDRLFINAVPEPSATILTLSGAVGILLRRRRSGR